MKLTRLVLSLVLALLAASPATATVPSTASSVGYTCNGVTTAYPAPFRFYAAGDLVVAKTETATGAVTPLVITTDYSVAGAGVVSGGTVNLVAGSRCGSGFTLSIKRTVTLTQGTSFRSVGVTSQGVEQAADRAIMAAQQIVRDQDARDDTQDAALALGAVGGSSTFVTSTGSSTARTLAARFADQVNVKDFGAAGDGATDDTAAIQAAIAFAETYAGGAGVYFPPGFYKISSTLRVRGNYIRLYGPTNVGDGDAAHKIGAVISGTVGGMGALVLVQADSGVIYGSQVDHLHLRTDGAGVDPIGISYFDASEIYASDLRLGQGLATGLKINGVGGAWIDRVVTTTTDAGIQITASGTVEFTATSYVWISGLNLWESSTAAILITGEAHDIHVSDSWIEHTPAGVLVRHDAGTTFSVEGLTVSDTTVFNGAATPYTNSRFFRATAASSADFVSVRNVLLRNCRNYALSATYNVELLDGTNAHASTAMRNVQIDGGQWYGASAAVLNMDASGYSAAFRGQIYALNDYQAGAAIPFAAGSGKYTRESRPVSELTNPAVSVFNAMGTDRGDNSATLVVGADAPTQWWATVLGANRTVTCSTTGAANGDNFRVVRTGLGAFTLDVCGLKTIPNSTAAFVDVAYDGSAWRLTGYGAL